MKLFKKFSLAATFLVATLGLSAFSANAVVITQDIWGEGPAPAAPVGTITLNIDNALVGTGIQTITGSIGADLDALGVGLDLLGMTEFSVIDFEAEINTDDLFGGIQFLTFVLDEVGPAFPFYTWELLIDATNPVGNRLDQFDFFDPFFDISYDTAFLGQASVVSEPSALAMFGLMLLMLMRQRRA